MKKQVKISNRKGMEWSVFQFPELQSLVEVHDGAY
jgi:RNA processing factor Prp31